MSIGIPGTKFNSKKEDTSYALGKISKALNDLSVYNPEVSIVLQMEVEKLRAENESLKEKLVEKEKYKEKVEFAVHDIRTPLSILLMAVKMCENLSEKERFMFTDSVDKIKKIAQEFLETSNDKNEEKKQEDQHIMVSQVLQNTVNQKVIQYNDKNVEFKYSSDNSLHFMFIHGNYLNFERMISNIINNSVDAFDGNKGTVKVELSSDNKNVKIIIQDNGRGMPPETVEKLMSGESISSTKQGGFGIGTTQIQKTIREFDGMEFIESKRGVGTKITLTIPKTHCP